MRLVLQRGEPGLNPKVNQLITLGARSRHELLVVSDSNVTVRREYLRDIAAYLEDPRVGLVTHPIAGAGEQTLGALFDNAHLSAGIAPGAVAANELANFPIVIGKSMALRRADLRALGGFASVKDVLAEDYVLGRRVPAELGKQVAVAHRPITAVSRERSVRGFLDRYIRWGTIQRRSVGPTRYAGMLLLHPLPAAGCALLVAPSAETGSALVACWLVKALLEHSAALSVRGTGFALAGFALMPLKDALLLCAWVLGFARNRVQWRGNQLAVLDGTRLVPIPEGHPRRWRTVPSATLLFATRLFR
jgi:ceramide glucosyltransferase